MGRAQRNGTSAGARRGARLKVNAVKNERVTRSSRSRLDDPAQVEKELNEQLRLMGLYAANTTGDGNCLFRALSDQLYGFPTQHARLRQETCNHLASHADKFAGFVDDQPFDDYVRLMRENGTYGGHLELHAFSQMMQKQIKIVQPGLVYVVSADDDSSEAIQAREAKEKERLKLQSSTAPGTEGGPLSEREQRRLKREGSRHRKRQSVQTLTSKQDSDEKSGPGPETASDLEPKPSAEADGDSSAAALLEAKATKPTNDTLVEAFGPLYIAYHNWEHYSSIRNLDGPHSGLPRIKERSTLGEEGDGSSAGHHEVTGGKKGSRTAAADEPSEAEKMVLQSTSGDYHIDEVRRLLHQHGQDWEHVVEILIERETTQDEATVGAELQAISIEPPSNGPGEVVDVLAPPMSLPDHMRQWRALSPSSVDTSITHSSGDADSPSTHATTEEGAEAPSESQSVSQSSRANTPAVERVSNKRAASADPSAIRSLRNPKRRSQSRSSDEGGGSRHAAPPAEPLLSPADEKADVASALEVPEVREVYEIIKRGRGRPRKDGLPNKSSVAIKRRVPNPREKRDAAIVRKRERQLEKVGRAKEASVETPSKASSEVRGFRELKI